MLIGVFGIVALRVIVAWGQAAAAKVAPTPILTYIDQTWATLTRSNRDLAKEAVDPKFKPDAQGKWAVYIPAAADSKQVASLLQRDMSPSEFQKLALLKLPTNTMQVKEQGLLYLPLAYVVPGGRFNEMYGWDSYFIQVGLLRDGKLDLARDMADNFLYEVKYYGKVLNANRTYYLTRSQPPFLTEMVLNVYHRTKDKRWLADALPWIERYYAFYTEAPHLTGTGLSRYFDLGEGPAPEVLSGEKNAQGLTHYDLVREYLRTHTVTDYDVSQFYDRATNSLTPLFYKGDRSMRESGFDPSDRFGPFNLDIIHYDPVCLNSLLYLMEMQIGDILDELGRGNESGAWRNKARTRADKINHLMWSDTDGLYYDYDFQTKGIRKYPFLTTFYPLWVGFATKQQAADVEKNLRLFEKKGGLETSTNASGNQWDAPFGWAPLEMIAADGLRKYGYTDDANRISLEFLRAVRENYLRQGFIVEKYDVVDPLVNVSSQIHFGYTTNEAGFGWTNAVFTELYDELPPADKRRIMGGQ